MIFSFRINSEVFFTLDAIDKKILAFYNQIPPRRCGDRQEVGLSTTPCWRRIQKMEDAGIIRSRVALLDAEKLNAGVTVFVSIKTDKHDAAWYEGFSSAVNDFPEVVEFYRMSGDIDYLLRVVVPDIAAYDRFYQRLIERVELYDVSSSFSMEQIKYTTALPLDYA